MKFLKHILVVIALIALALPCGHAADHAGHTHGADVETQLCSSHACACHACDETPCGANPELPQELTLVSSSVIAPRSPIYLFVLPETKPLTRLAPLPVAGTLAVLQTVQLLI